MLDKLTNSEAINQVKISNDVIGSIANLAAMKIEGVVAMSQTLTGGVASKLGMKSQVKTTKVELDETSCNVYLSIIVEYGVNIVDVCKKVQQEVKKSIEAMTDLEVKKVDVIVAWIEIPKIKKNEEDMV